LLLACRLDNLSTRIEDGPFGIASIAEAFNSENTSDSDLKATGNIGVKFHASKAFSFTANVTNSFRGTDLFSKYHFAEVGQGFLVPNPNLNSETGLFYELGAKYKFGRLTIEANYFQNYLNNLFEEANIVFEDRPSVQNQNIGKARFTGF
jgi:outer membrane receptor protein involved in Fe transport